jgi:hypothetical protein
VRVKTTRALQRRDDRGAVLVFAALILAALLIFAALVIDIANATQVRRQSQNTADAASLAGAADLPNGPAAAAAVKAYAERNLDIPAADWVGCRDAERLPVLPDPASDNQCISIDNEYSQVRVKLPTREVETFFARIIGSDHVKVGADAVAEAQLRKNTRIIPATITVAAGTGLMCIENSGNNATCASRVRGQFGNLDSPRLYIYKPDSNQDPSNLRTNYAMSLDHEVVIWKSGAVNVCDGDSEPSPCSLNNTDTLYDANYLMPYTGNAIPPVTEGWVQGFTVSTHDMGDVSFCGRLQRPDITAQNITEPQPDGCTNPGMPQITVTGTVINGRHISHWMQPWARTAFYPELGTAKPAIGDSRYVAGDARLDCFLTGYHYDKVTRVETVPSCPGLTLPARSHVWPMFEQELANDPRFGIIPVVQAFGSGNSNPYKLVDFLGEFTYNLYPNNSNTKVAGVDAFIFDTALIETEDGEPGSSFGIQPDPVIRLIK